MTIDVSSQPAWIKSLTDWNTYSSYGISGPFSWTGSAGTAATIDYSIEGANAFFDGTGLGGAPATATDFPGSLAQLQAILALFSSVANVTFVHDETSPALVFAGGTYTSGEAGIMVPSVTGSQITEADIYSPVGDYSLGSTNAATLIHEILHSLGISHPNDANYEFGIGSAADPNYDVSLTAVSDRDATVTLPNGDLRSLSDPSTPMPDDIATLQFLYGAAAHNTGDTTYTIAGDGTIAVSGGTTITGQLVTIWDSAGSDTYTVGTGVSTDVRIDLRAGTSTSAESIFNPYVEGQVYSTVIGDNVVMNALGSAATIENATGGSGNDKIYGNDVANTLVGLNGNDTFIGGAGDDLIYGGAIDNSQYGLASDGTDVFLARDSGASDDTTFDLQKHYTDGVLSYVTLTNNTTHEVDTLRSIEQWGVNTFKTINKIDLSDATDSIHLHDLTPDDLASRTAQFTVSDSSEFTVTSGMTETVGDTTFEYWNFGTFQGSSVGGDEFDLNLQIGRIFTGGGDGTNANTISYAGVTDTGGMTIDLNQGLAWLNANSVSAGPPDTGADEINNFQNAVGTAFDDLIVGTAGANILSGGDGNDTLIGGAGADTCYGGAGNDTFQAAASCDPTPVFDGASYDGGTGIDTLDCSHLTLASGMGVVVEVDDSQNGELYQYDSTTGNWSDDYNTFSSIENVTLTAGNDVVLIDLTTDATVHTIDCVGGTDVISLGGATLDATDNYIYNWHGDYATTEDSSHFLNLGSSLIGVNTILADVAANGATYTEVDDPQIGKTIGTVDFSHATSGATFDISGSFSGGPSSGTYDMTATAHLPDSVTQTIYASQGSFDSLHHTYAILPNITGTDHGDTYNVDLAAQYPDTPPMTGFAWLDTGMGNDTVNVLGLGEQGSVDITYRGGDDTYNLTTYTPYEYQNVTFDEEIQMGDVTVTGFDTLDSGGVITVTHVQFTIDGRGTMDLYSDDLNGIDVGFASGGDMLIDTTGVHSNDGYDPSTSTMLTWNDDVYTIRDNSLGELDSLGGNDTITGNSSDNLIYLGAGNDIGYGNGGSDTIYGGDGNDTLDGGDGLDTLIGGAGADTFVFHAATAFNNIDVVSDFTTSENDKIDISDLLTGYHAGTDDINDCVHLTVNGSDTQLSVDLDGTGSAHSMAQIATLTGVTGLNIDTLVANGNLVIS